MSDYRQLDAWRLAHTTRLEIYRATATYPAHEQFGLVAQTRRAVSSIAANIAEGAGRDSRVDFARFLSIGVASANETEDHLLLARDLGYLSTVEWKMLTDHLSRVRSMLINLRRYLRSTRGTRSAGNG